MTGHAQYSAPALPGTTQTSPLAADPAHSDPLPGTLVDAVVIGGGAAGLNGALMLARSRRSVVVLDAGHPRNAPAEGIQDRKSVV